MSMMSSADSEMRTRIEDSIKRLLVSELEIDSTKVAAITADTPLIGRGIGIDSMETLVLISGVEREFDIQIDDAELSVPLFRTFGSLTDFVLSKVNERKETR